jgi:hypothetical protein
MYNRDYARMYGLKPSEVAEHQTQQLAELLRLAGCEIMHHGSGFLALLPGSKRPLTLRAAMNHAKRSGLVRGLLQGCELPAIEVQTTVRGECRRELRVWCPSCTAWHTHGYGHEDTATYGPRAPHCRDKDRGAFGGSYVLVPPLQLRAVAP